MYVIYVDVDERFEAMRAIYIWDNIRISMCEYMTGHTIITITITIIL
jgi:hypothetical protein